MGETGDTEDTGYTSGDTDSIRWRNTWKLLTGGLTEEGRRQYRRDRDLRYAQEDCQRCQKERDYLLRYSIESCFLDMAELTRRRSYNTIPEPEDHSARRRFARWEYKMSYMSR